MEEFKEGKMVNGEMTVTKQQAQNIVWDDTDEWLKIQNNIVDTSRWSESHEGVYKHKPTNKYYEFGWSEGLTERQEEQPFEYDDDIITPQEVESKEVLKIIWVAVK